VDNLPVFVDSDDLSDKSFSFYLHNLPEESYMVIPGFEESATSLSSMQFHTVAQQKYWSINLTSMRQEGGQTVDMTGYYAVIDSGTSVIVADQALVDKITEGIVVRPNCANLDSLPTITFTLDGIDYPMSPRDYVLQVEDMGITQCVMGIMGSVFPPNFNYFILGDSFMRRYQTYFDKNNNRVGFTIPASN